MKRYLSLPFYVTAVWLVLLSIPCFVGGAILSSGSFGYDVAAIPLGLASGFASLVLADLSVRIAERIEGI